MSLLLLMTDHRKSESHSVLSDSLGPHGLQRARLLCPWDSPGKNTGVGSHSGLQGIFPTQGSNPDRTAGRFFTVCSSNHFLLAPEVPNSQPEKFQNCGMNPCVLNPYWHTLRGTGPGLTHCCPAPCYLLDAPLGPEAPAPPLGPDDLCVWVEPLGEALVLAALPRRAHLGVTLILQHPVQALGLQATRVLVGRLAVAAGNLRQVCHLDLYLSYHFVGLATKSQVGGRNLNRTSETPRPAWPRYCLWGDPEKGFPQLSKLRWTAASLKLTKIPKPDMSPHLSCVFPLLPVDDHFIKLKTALGSLEERG